MEALELEADDRSRRRVDRLRRAAKLPPGKTLSTLERERLPRTLDHFELIIVDDLGHIQQHAEEVDVLFLLIAERYERRSLVIPSNRPVEDWGRLLGDTVAMTAMLDRLLHHGHVLRCGPRGWRTKVTTLQRQAPKT